MSKVQIDTLVVESSLQELKRVQTAVGNTAQKVKWARNILTGADFLNVFSYDSISQITNAVKLLEYQEQLLQNYVNIIQQINNSMLNVDFGGSYDSGYTNTGVIAGKSSRFNINNIVTVMFPSLIPGIAIWKSDNFHSSIENLFDNNITCIPQIVDNYMSENKKIMDFIGDVTNVSDCKIVGGFLGLINSTSKGIQAALKGEADFSTYLDIFKNGVSFSGKIIDSDNLGFIGDVSDLILEEWEAIKSGDVSEFLLNADGVVESAAGLGKTIAEFKGLIEEGLGGTQAAQEAFTAVTTAATMITHLAGDVIACMKDGVMDLQDCASTSMDVGVSGGASLVKGLTLGLVDIDTEKASSIYTDNAIAVSDYLSETDLPLEAQCVLGAVSSPVTFVVSTAEIAVDTALNTLGNLKKGYDLINQGKEWVRGQISSGLYNLLT